MLPNRTPAVLLDQQASALRTRLDTVLDGDANAVHDARVATRRIRELLALVPLVPGRDGERDIAASYKKVNRALGVVRDIDVQIGLIRSLEAHAPSLVVVRQDHERTRLRGMRRLIKTLEGIDIDSLVDAVSAGHPAGLRNRLGASGWRQQLRQLVLERSRTAAERITHATGVYFPNRVHSARIAIKKLRYALEIMEATGLADADDAVRPLRKAQEILGDLHDRHVLSKSLSSYGKSDGVEKDDLELVGHVLQDEVLALHQRYLERRAMLCAICAEMRRLMLRMPGRTASARVIGGVIAVSGLVYGSMAALKRTKELTQPSRAIG